MGWFERAKKASAGQRVTRSDKQHAIDAVAELNALNADRERLMREGLRGIATIVAIHENVTTTPLGSWHKLEWVQRYRCESIPGTSRKSLSS
jgi:hypothetical protein